MYWICFLWIISSLQTIVLLQDHLNDIPKSFPPIDLQSIIQVQASHTICAKADCDRSKAGWDSAQSEEDICGPGLWFASHLHLFQDLFASNFTFIFGFTSFPCSSLYTAYTSSPPASWWTTLSSAEIVAIEVPSYPTLQTLTASLTYAGLTQEETALRASLSRAVVRMPR